MEDPTIHEFLHIIASLPEPYKTKVQTMWDIFGDDFQIMPASNRFHSNFPGGLLVHTVWTIRIAKFMYKRFKAMDSDLGQGLDFKLDEAIFILVLHDFGKIYEQTITPYRDHVTWIGEMLNKAKIGLTEKQAHAILHHHGGYGVKGSPPTKLSTFVHTCDNWASMFLETVV